MAEDENQPQAERPKKRTRKPRDPAKPGRVGGGLPENNSYIPEVPAPGDDSVAGPSDGSSATDIVSGPLIVRNGAQSPPSPASPSRLSLGGQSAAGSKAERLRRLKRGNGRRVPVFVMRNHNGSNHRPHLRIWLSLFIVAFLGIPIMVMILMASAGAGAYNYFTRDLPSIASAKGISFETTKIYDRHGNLLHEIYDSSEGMRTYVSLQEISPYVITATIATEDANFYSNSGVDAEAIVRAVYINYSGKGSSGASTITQQLVRNIILKQEKYERTLTRKIREALLAIEFSRTYSKDKILEMYLNEVYYGNLAYGIDAAAQSYFGKLSKDLDLAESSMLAGLPQAPSSYDPTKNWRAAKQRQKIVLGLMVKQGYITPERAAAADAEELHFVQRKSEMRAPHFVYYVKEVLEGIYGPDMVNQGGLTVYTTMDLDFQAAAEDVVRKQVAQLKEFNAHNGALVAMKPGTGEILAMVGSVDYNDKSIDGEVNIATWERQPGSSFKPITYLAAFKKGWNPATLIADSRTEFDMGPGSKPYVPENYDRKYHGPVSLRLALANSLNIPAVKVLRYAGLQDTIDLAHSLGITGLQRGLSNYGLSLTLGGGEVKLLDLTTAYSTIANEGRYTGPISILKVLDRDGKVIYDYQPPKKAGREVVSPQLAYLMTNILSDNKAREPMFGVDNPLKLDRPAAAKTGTTDDWKDNWTMGYTPGLVAGVWVGNTDNQEMQHISGITGAAPIWHDFMERVYGDSKLTALLKGPDDQDLPTDFQEPPGIVKVEVSRLSGQLATPNCPKVTEVFVQGTEPKDKCILHGGAGSGTWVNICTKSNSLATKYCPKDEVMSRFYPSGVNSDLDYVKEYNEFVKDYGRNAGKYWLIEPGVWG
ncbi:MAG: PBP1A family penicillin-binding protein, partial [Chloroflexi bacterium]|nr:PBP1A family penicillin-binding protein [Chloroflexota bacterium]